MNKVIIDCDNLYKIYKTDDDEVFALSGIDLEIEEGEVMAIIGSSGSGKSSLLNVIGGLDKPTTGKLFVDGIDMFKLSEKQMRLYRRKTVGFVWQDSSRNLLNHLTALENVEMITRLTMTRKESRKAALELLEKVHLSDRANINVCMLSGGEQQRVGIAIALANKPKILLADEPTGSVDSKTGAEILKLFNEINRTMNVTVVIVTHDMRIAHSVRRVVSIDGGKIFKELIAKQAYTEEDFDKNIMISNIDEGNTHEEFLVIDRHNRVQIPEQFLEELRVNKNGRVKAKMDEGKIVLYTK